MGAFDTLTGLALPMLDVAEAVRAFSSDSTPALELAAALPAPQPLTAETANTPALQAILKAHQAAAAAKAATASGGWRALAGAALESLGETGAGTSPRLG
ncbi:hypothetical protein D9M70_611230 [compost metagenome]